MWGALGVVSKGSKCAPLNELLRLVVAPSTGAWADFLEECEPVALGGGGGTSCMCSRGLSLDTIYGIQLGLPCGGWMDGQGKQNPEALNECNQNCVCKFQLIFLALQLPKAIKESLKLWEPTSKP